MDYHKYHQIHKEASTVQMKHGGGIHSVIDREKRLKEICMKHGCTVKEYRSHRRVYAHGGSIDANSFQHHFNEALKGSYIEVWRSEIKNKKPSFAQGGSTPKAVQSKLANSFRLPFQLSVYVPSTEGVDRKISQEEFDDRIEEVERFLSFTFGGYSQVDVNGGYISNNNELVKEEIGRVTAFCGVQNFTENVIKVLQKIVDWCGKWTQESIGFEFEGDLYYIDSSQKFGRGGQTSRKNYIAWKMHEVMSEFKQGKLRSSSGDKVTDRKQAIAIGLSVANRAWDKKSKRK